MSDKPAEAPEHCPGTKSNEAGKTAACAGCPNQSICASTPKGPDPDLALISHNLSGVRHRILILSGKGGVGKSSVTAHLARSLAVTADATLQIGILDVDICGPSQPQMLGLPEERMHTSQFGFAPVVSDEFGNVSVVSVGFLLEGETDAVIWRGPKKNALVKRFLRDVQWEEMDFLLVDTPPGTSDEHLALAQLISPITGAILVTTPQEIAWQDVRKEIDFCKKTGIPIIGIVENMAGFVCGHCHRPSEVFTSGSLREYTTHHGIPILASIPIDPTLGMACDRGERLPADSPLCGIYTDLASKIVAHVNR